MARAQSTNCRSVNHGYVKTQGLAIGRPVHESRKKPTTNARSGRMGSWTLVAAGRNVTDVSRPKNTITRCSACRPN